MRIIKHLVGQTPIAEIVSDDILIRTTSDALDLLGNAYYQGFEGMIVHQNNLTTDFFNLKTRLAGDILQKFSNYRMRLVVVGDFSGYSSQSLKDFILESNQGKLINFASTLDEAKEKLAS